MTKLLRGLTWSRRSREEELMKKQQEYVRKEQEL